MPAIQTKIGPPQQDLLEILEYDPEVGSLIWRERPLKWFAENKRPEAEMKRWNKRFAGTLAGRPKGARGYMSVKILAEDYFAHRVIWCMQTGAWPVGYIDHIDHNGSNNAWHNLRVVDHSGNARNRRLAENNISGAHGVSWHQASGTWHVEIFKYGKKYYLGSFDRRSDAVEMRRLAEIGFGFHPNHGQ